MTGEVATITGDSNRRKIWLHQFVHFFGSEAWIPYSIGSYFFKITGLKNGDNRKL